MFPYPVPEGQVAFEATSLEASSGLVPVSQIISSKTVEICGSITNCQHKGPLLFYQQKKTFNV